jgi:hypothetical protein
MVTAIARTTASVSYFTLASTRAKHDLKRPRTLGSAGDWEGYHENSVPSLNDCRHRLWRRCRRFDRDWFRSMDGRAHQSARPLDRSGDRIVPNDDERKRPRYYGVLRPRLCVPLSRSQSPARGRTPPLDATSGEVSASQRHRHRSLPQSSFDFLFTAGAFADA